MSIYSRYHRLLSQRVAHDERVNMDANPFIRNKIARHEANANGGFACVSGYRSVQDRPQ